MLLSISVFVLVVIARGGSVLPNGIQNNGGAIVAADINKDSYNNRMRRSPESDAGAAAEDYLLNRAVKVKILRDGIVYKRVGGYNRAVADFDFLQPEHTTTTKWDKYGLTHIIGQVGDRVLVFTIDDAKKTPILVLSRIHPVTGTIYSLRFVYTSSNEMDTF